MMSIEKHLKTYCVGLTGGIATGKSFIGSYLKKKGFIVLNADTLSRELVSQGSSLLTKIVGYFGEVVLDQDRELNRKLLREIIFKNAISRKWLENLIHPAIRISLEKKINDLGLVHSPKIWFYEAPLIFETKTEKKFRQIWLTWCKEKIQIERLMKRDKITCAYAKTQIRNQIPYTQKLARVDFSINTSIQKEEVLERVDERLKSFLF